jgi:hypothetical protein
MREAAAVVQNKQQVVLAVPASEATAVDICLQHLQLQMEL